MMKTTRSVKRKQLYAIVTTLLLCPAWTGFAAPSDVPDAGNILQNTKNVERNLPSRQQVNVETKDAAPSPMVPDNGFKTKVDGFVVKGQNVISQGELDNLLKDYLHKEITFAELNKAAVIVANHFKEQGYLLAQAYLPAQEITNGKVEITVLVGRYGDIILKNSSKVADWVIRSQLTGLNSGSYINNEDLERAVLLAGDLAGVSAKIVLSPGKTPGTADVIIEAKKREGIKKGSIVLNNWGNRFTGSNQGTINYTFSNFAHIGDSFNTSITNAGSGLDTAIGSYRLPLGEGVNLNLSYSKVHYSLGEEYAILNAHGTAYTQHADAAWNIKRTRDMNLSIQAGYDHKRLEDLYDSSGTKTNKYSDVASLGVIGDSMDTFWGGGANSYSVMWYRGHQGAAVINGDMPMVGSWQKTNYNFLRQQFVTKRLSLQLSFSGQLASTNLDSSEKFSLGGANGVRAYPVNEASGDEAWLINSELRWTIPVKSEKGILQLIGFYDAGVANLEKNPSGTTGNRKALAGKGLGFSWTVPEDYAVKLNYAWKASSTTALADRDKNGRLWLQAYKYF